MGLDGQNWRGLKWIAFGWIWKTSATVVSNLSQFLSKCHLHRSKTILSCYVTMILSIWRLELIVNGIKQN